MGLSIHPTPFLSIREINLWDLLLPMLGMMFGLQILGAINIVHNIDFWIPKRIRNIGNMALVLILPDMIILPLLVLLRISLAGVKLVLLLIRKVVSRHYIT